MSQGRSITEVSIGICIGALAGVALLLLLSPVIRQALSITGVAIGIFMGVLAGVALLLLLSPLIIIAPKAIASPKPIAAIAKLILQLTTSVLSLPAITFGGSWMSNAVLRVKDDANFSDCYTLTLTLTFIVIIVYPVSQWIMNCGRNMSGSPLQIAPPQSVASNQQASNQQASP